MASHKNAEAKAKLAATLADIAKLERDLLLAQTILENQRLQEQVAAAEAHSHQDHDTRETIERAERRQERQRRQAQVEKERRQQEVDRVAREKEERERKERWEEKNRILEQILILDQKKLKRQLQELTDRTVQRELQTKELQARTDEVAQLRLEIRRKEVEIANAKLDAAVSGALHTKADPALIRERNRLKGELEEVRAELNEHEELKALLIAQDLPIRRKVPDWGTEWEASSKVECATLVSGSMAPKDRLGTALIMKDPVLEQMRIATTPFAKGGQRFAFYAERLRDNAKLVVKKFLAVSPRQTKEAAYKKAEVNLRMLSLAGSCADAFSEKLHDGTKVRYVSHVLIRNPTDEFHDYWMAEELLPGEQRGFIKFNKNDGKPYPAEAGSEVMQALSHFSFSYFGEQAVLVDVQGVYLSSSKSFTLTDPAFQSATSGERRSIFGDTDLGKDGIKGFFENHTCGASCGRLGLRKPASPYS